MVKDLSFDFVNNNPESVPCMDEEECPKGFHGTAVAGVAAAIGFNSLGGRGVAYRAQVADLRVPIGHSYTEFISSLSDRFVDAIHYGANEITIKNHSYGDKFYAHTVTDDTQSIYSSAENYAIQQTTADGMIHVKSAGNERVDWNHRKAANIPEEIVVAALGVHGRYSKYSNYGAGVFVTAPSSDPDWDSNIGIVTTTLTNIPFGSTSGYTTSFGGTSAAAPQVAGALALAKEIRPDLEVRLAKHLLVSSSRPIDLDDPSSRGGWTVNQAGCAFNPNYGFGLLDVERLVKLASDLTISRLSTWDITAKDNGDHLPLDIPDHDTTPLSFEIMAENSTSDPFSGIRPVLTKPLEEVGVTVDIGHTRPGDVEVVLVSPGGTRSRLRSSYDEGGSYTEDQPIRRTYWSNAFWGETPSGNWTLEIHDKVSGESGRINDYTLHLRMGSVTAPADFKVCAQHQEAFRL